jgi:uncharacterized integral membrane protein
MDTVPKSLPVALVVVPLLGLLLFVFTQVYTASNGQMGAVFWFRTYPGLIVALASGFFGATFSMLVQAQRRTEGTLEDLSSACAWRTLVVRGFVGLGGAAILYFFFRSGLLEGTLWPDLRQLGYEALAGGGSDGLVPNEHWCLLVIWCFLGGFSETLVPNILTKTEAKASVS